MDAFEAQNKRIECIKISFGDKNVLSRGNNECKVSKSKHILIK